MVAVTAETMCGAVNSNIPTVNLSLTDLKKGSRLGHPASGLAKQVTLAEETGLSWLAVSFWYVLFVTAPSGRRFRTRATALSTLGPISSPLRLRSRAKFGVCNSTGTLPRGTRSNSCAKPSGSTVRKASVLLKGRTSTGMPPTEGGSFSLGGRSAILRRTVATIAGSLVNMPFEIRSPGRTDTTPGFANFFKCLRMTLSIAASVRGVLCFLVAIQNLQEPRAKSFQTYLSKTEAFATVWLVQDIFSARN